MEEITTFQGLLDEIKSRADGKTRLLFGIAGPPVSGKSTLAEDLANGIGSSAAVLPMGGLILRFLTIGADHFSGGGSVLTNRHQNCWLRGS
jgi:putative protein kinase ArgK-like GTPase of G3E family